MQYKRFTRFVGAGLCAFLVKRGILLVLFCLLLASCDLPGGTPALAGHDWPMLGYDVSASSINNETTLSPSNISQLNKFWSFQTQGVIAASATVVGYTIFIGSWDGYEYSIDSQSGALNWKTYLGETVGNSWCQPPKVGVTSTATYLDGTLYLGGGDSYWYALNAQTGQVEWKIFTGDNSAKSGYYNWSSPLIYDGYAYVGTASLGDCPLAQGQLLKVSLKDHKVVQRLNMVPDGEVGGGIWSPLVFDKQMNEIFLSTGTANALTQIYAQALLGIDLKTFTIKQHWRLPEQSAIVDSDFGGGPALFQTSDGSPRVILVNKNGIAYAFDRNNIAAGPVWQTYIAEGGLSPDAGGGSISTALFANHMVYMAGGNSIVNNQGYQGSVRALDPDTGKTLWVHKTTGPVLGALTYSNGMLFANAGDVLEVLNPRDGTRIASYTFDKQIYDVPVVSHGQILIGDTDGSLYALGLPREPIRVASGTKCGNLTCWDIANPSTSTTYTLGGSGRKITAGGFGMNINSDQFNFAAQNVSGDIQVSVKVASLQGSNDLAQSGLMIRQSADPGSPFYGVFVRRDHELAILYRATNYGTIGSLAPAGLTASVPVYLEVQRVDDQFIAATSTDGEHYVGVPGSALTLALLTKQLAGVATSSGSDQSITSANYENLTFSTPTVTPDGLASSTPCISGWECNSIGYPTVVGTQKVDGQNFTIAGAGIDINGYTDQFHFVSQQITQDGTISARLVSQTAITPWSKAGLMIRQGDDADASFYAVLLTPDNGLLLEYRYGKGLAAAMTTVTLNPRPTTPLYLKIAKAGNIFSTYQSTDGTNWNFMLGTNVQMDLSGPMQVGMAVTSDDGGHLGSATFDSVQVADSAPPPVILCPDTWMCDDVGYANSMLAGTQIYNNGNWLLEGAGDDIDGTSDWFHAVWQTLGGDGSVSARVTSIQEIDPHTKAGVMLRTGQDPGSPFYALVATPHKGLIVEYRDQQADIDVLNDIPLNTDSYLPIYLKVTRAGDVFSAYYSQNGVDWNLVPNETVTLNMPETLFAGLVLTSHATLQLATANFDSVSVGQ